MKYIMQSFDELRVRASGLHPRSGKMFDRSLAGRYFDNTGTIEFDLKDRKRRPQMLKRFPKKKYDARVGPGGREYNIMVGSKEFNCSQAHLTKEALVQHVAAAAAVANPAAYAEDAPDAAEALDALFPSAEVIDVGTAVRYLECVRGLLL